MTLPLVSAIIPTFNRATLVREAIDSVLAQTYPRIELLVVDDGSTDDTAALAGHYGPAVTCIRQPHAGVSAARNRGVAASHGALIAFLDSDDRWLPGKIAAQVAFLQRTQHVQACHTDEIWIRHGVRVNPRHIHQKHGGHIFLQSLPRCIISPSAIMMQRRLWERLGGFDERLPACEDYDLWLRLTLLEPVAFVPEPLVVKHGGHADQLSRSTPVLDRYRITALEKLLTAALTPPQYRAVLEQLVYKCHIVAQGARKRQHTARWAVYDAKERAYRQRLMRLQHTAASAG